MREISRTTECSRTQRSNNAVALPLSRIARRSARHELAALPGPFPTPTLEAAARCGSPPGPHRHVSGESPSTSAVSSITRKTVR